MGKKVKVSLLVIMSVIMASGLMFSLGEAVKGNAAGMGDDDDPKLFYPRPQSSDNFPCTKCHKFRPINKEKRKLTLNHTNIELKHAEKHRWCFDCHEGDKLRLPNGELIEYNKPYILCGQCHGTIYRDWKAGIHGKTVGTWTGEKIFYVCVSCHDPHQPKFKQLEPEKQPLRPTEIKIK